MPKLKPRAELFEGIVGLAALSSDPLYGRYGSYSSSSSMMLMAGSALSLWVPPPRSPSESDSYICQFSEGRDWRLLDFLGNGGEADDLVAIVFEEYTEDVSRIVGRCEEGSDVKRWEYFVPEEE